MDALWPGLQPRTARKSLQSHVSRLRSELADLSDRDLEPITWTGDGYRIDLTEHPLDAARFEDLVARSRERLDRSDPQDAAELLEDALGLWRGRAYRELSTLPRLRGDAERLEQLCRTARADRREA